MFFRILTYSRLMVVNIFCKSAVPVWGPSRSLLGRSNALPSQPARCYAKKGKKEGAGIKIRELSPEELSSVVSHEEMIGKMEEILHRLQKDYVDQLTLHKTVGLFDRLLVETKDGTFPLIQLAQVIQKNPQLVTINMSLSPQYSKEVRDSIIKAGMNPQQDGTSLFVAVPKVTREHRQSMSNTAKSLCDRCKEKLRDVHKTFHRQLSRSDGQKDLIHSADKFILDTLHAYSKKAEDLMTAKQKELMEK